ncbi:MAG: WD40 repeat domain-containing protein [Treponema sp.]|nr:WD40 repeat domain-containing protein [Treponema sp.]
MAKQGRKYWLAGTLFLFVVYMFAAARPIPQETIMVPQWLSSLESGYSMPLAGPESAGVPDGESPVPFQLGDRFGYVDAWGALPINRVKDRNLFLSVPYWAEYDDMPEQIEILDNAGSPLFSIDETGAAQGYPLYLDGRLFLIGKEMNTLISLDDEGKPLWSYDFAAPLTCIDGAAGFILTGSLDGAVEILNPEGKQFFYFPPGGSRIPVILGCAISRDGSRLGIVSGIDDQRFLLLERYGDPGRGEFRVVYHEFLDDGFRRPVHISFIDNDDRIIFERQEGIGIYDLRNRANRTIPLEGTVLALDTEGSGNIFFVISTQGRQKELVGIKLPGTIILRVPFRSDHVFFRRSGPRLYLGGGNALAAFELGKR